MRGFFNYFLIEKIKEKNTFMILLDKIIEQAYTHP